MANKNLFTQLMNMYLVINDKYTFNVINNIYYLIKKAENLNIPISQIIELRVAVFSQIFNYITKKSCKCK